MSRPSIRLGFAENALDRAGVERDPVAHLRHVADPGALAVLVAGELAALRQADGEASALLPVTAVEDGWSEPVFLGRLGDRPVVAVAPDAAGIERLGARPGWLVTDLRSIAVQGLVPAPEAGLLAQAKSLLLWHARHRFCANCGAATVQAQAGLRRDCAGCGAQHFPRTDPVTIMLVARGEHCLLGRQARFVPGSYSCLAGFVSPGETIEDAVRRETREETGIEVGAVRYLLSQPWPFPSSLMIGCLGEALSQDVTVDREELEDARWFSREEVGSMLDRTHPGGLLTPPPMAIAHHLIRAWVEGAVPV